MALLVKTSDPDRLLELIKKAIKAKKVRTWKVDKDGDFEYKPEQYENDVFWFHPISDHENEWLRFGFREPENIEIDKVSYGLFHGRFASMIIGHFENEFQYIRIPSKPIKDLDFVGAYLYMLKIWKL
jgi:hypothetical protein